MPTNPESLVKVDQLQYCHLFRNVSATNEGMLGNFADFPPKIGCHGNIP